MPPPPAKWKGKFEFTGSVTCNNKLIGARNLLGGGSSDPPFDYTGHGTHTSSTAAGNFVDWEIVHVLPATIVDSAEGEKIKAYVTSSSTTSATIVFKGTKIGSKDAPSVAYFSSRGLNSQSPSILKPDIIGPRLNILTAWPTSVENINSTFNIISGTSMYCPHLNGIVALLKIAHPDWSPVVIKSVTTNQSNCEDRPILDERELHADVFAIGAGHIDRGRSGPSSSGMLITDRVPVRVVTNLISEHSSWSQGICEITSALDIKFETIDGHESGCDDSLVNDTSYMEVIYRLEQYMQVPKFI
ncbi:hypothetical protein BC332_00389 [Capsicum chinense]|nr:hypothetical protein BC332_00389 [Capsicum chinense]